MAKASAAVPVLPEAPEHSTHAKDDRSTDSAYQEDHVNLVDLDLSLSASGSGSLHLLSPKQGKSELSLGTHDGDLQDGGAGGMRVAVEGDDEEELPPRCELEGFTRCSNSLLWRLMMSFYDRKGVESWSQGIVPHFITCNSFIGRSYAQVLCGFLRDCVMNPTPGLELDFDQPLYIIELGAGSGKFSFLMLKALLEMEDTCAFPVSKIVYVMTDFTERNFAFWASHPQLQPLVDAGRLDMAIFDAVADKEIRLAQSGVVLSPGSVVNPICVVANYLFDTLCHDIYQVDEGGLKEGLISVGSSRPFEHDPLDPDIIQHFQNEFLYQPIDAGSCYSAEEEEGDDESFRDILQWYVDAFQQSPEGCSLLFPVGALRAIRRLLRLSGSRGLFISGDKGNNNPEQFRGLVDPHIAVHGSFSVMVNYHAIGAYFTSKGGMTLHNPQEEASLKVSAFVARGEETLGGTRPENWQGANLAALDAYRLENFPSFRAAFKHHLADFGPNDFFVMQKALKDDAPTPSLRGAVALLKLGDWDADVFYKFKDTFLNQVASAGIKLRNDICRGIPRVWENFYMLDKEKDIAFEIGRLYYGIRLYDEALEFYTHSRDTVGEHHVTYHNMGLCHYSKGDLHKSLLFFESALHLCPEYKKASTWMLKVQEELRPLTAPGEDSGRSL